MRLIKMESLDALQAKVSKIEYIVGQGAEETVRKMQEQMLQDLYKLREALNEDLKVQTPVTGDQDLLNEIKRLQEENTKLQYRIHHLKQHIV